VVHLIHSLWELRTGRSSLIRQLHNLSVVLKGEGHTNLVSGLSAGSDGTLYSSGFDDRVHEISANDGGFSFMYVRSSCLTMILNCITRQATFRACSQPKTLTIAGDDTLFVVKINVIEAIRSNQRVFELKPKYSPSAIAATRDIITVGSEVSCLIENFSQSLCHGSCYAAIRIIWFTCIHGMGRC